MLQDRGDARSTLGDVDDAIDGPEVAVIVRPAQAIGHKGPAYLFLVHFPE
jgi:hypothetical protein